MEMCVLNSTVIHERKNVCDLSLVEMTLMLIRKLHYQHFVHKSIAHCSTALAISKQSFISHTNMRFLYFYPSCADFCLP